MSPHDALRRWTYDVLVLGRETVPFVEALSLIAWAMKTEALAVYRRKRANDLVAKTIESNEVAAIMRRALKEIAARTDNGRSGAIALEALRKEKERRS